MIIGVPAEVKNNENRVALTPAGAKTLILQGHTVYVEAGAGGGSGFYDTEYADAGAVIVPKAEEVWARSEMIMKVKEPVAGEYRYFRSDLTLFAYLHLAAEPKLTKALIDSGITAIAYETVAEGGALPLLTPMSEVAGRMAVQVGAQLLEKPNGGKGILLSGIPGVPRARVTIIGGGVVGTNAAKIAVGMGADVTIIDSSLPRLRQLDDLFGRQIHTLASSPATIAEAAADTDLLIGAVLIPGAKAPKLVTEEMVRSMRKGSVIVDVAVDQGGIVETIDHTTTHDDPTYMKHGVVHYAVANMPGAVPRTSTLGLTNATLPYALQLAKLGSRKAILASPALKSGANAIGGRITHEAVAKALGYDYVPAEQALDGLKTV
ncbi:alanine dehydrogenase [Paenibacillus thailandensis]|uniref:Alanine dehydrogenase n=1 Tax=Paenibacillus thailandensis TaxID=393250 RepID=A0ABW5QX26_9BACL